MNLVIVENEVLNEFEIETKTNVQITREHYDMVYHIKLETDKEIVSADGTDSATIFAEIYNYLDEPQISWVGDIIFELDGEQQVVPTTNGKAQITFDTSVAGEYIIKTNIPNLRNELIKVVAE